MWFTSQKDSPPNFDAKTWEPVFSKDRKFNEDSPYIELRKRSGVDSDHFGIFWRDTEDPVPFCTVEEVEAFCQGVRLGDLEAIAGTEGERHSAWLDDRSFPHSNRSACVRKYQNPLTATELYRHLKKQRFANADEPDAERRLIYIADLDPYYILALTETATFHQASVLRDAIWKYLALQTSIRVKIPSAGYLIFELEFHLPYFALRTSSPPELPPRRGVKSKPARKWKDLSFLKMGAFKSQHERKYGIYEGQISFALCGPHESQWVAYAFVDTDFDGNDLEDGIFSYEGFQEDPIVSDIDANIPIRSPRLYFLVALKSRIAQILREWQYLVRMVECSIKQYTDQYTSTLSQDPEAPEDRDENLKESFDWTLQTIEILRQLLATLSETTKAWERFTSVKGDMGYFSNVDSSKDKFSAHQLFRTIKETFETLENLQQKLVDLEKSCQDSAQALQLRLTLESNKAAQHSGVTAWFTISVITPCALATGYFAIPQAAIPFELNFKSFIIAIFVIMIVMRVLYMVQHALLHRSGWWKKAPALMKMQLDEIAHCLSIEALARRRRTYASRTVDGTEMETFEV